MDIRGQEVAIILGYRRELQFPYGSGLLLDIGELGRGRVHRTSCNDSSGLPLESLSKEVATGLHNCEF